MVQLFATLVSNPDTHASEQQIDLLDADYDIDNNGTMEELHRTVKNIERSLEYCL